MQRFAFVHHQVQQWIDPDFNFDQIKNNWDRIVAGLSESPRKRIPQMTRAFPG